MGLGTRDIQIALITAMVESNLINVNYGDRDSLGLFQQRPSQGWGTPEQVTDPYYAARKFYSTMKSLVGDRRFSMGMGEVAQAVQRSAYPDRYGESIGAMRMLWPQIGQGAGDAPASMDGGAYLPEVDMPTPTTQQMLGSTVEPAVPRRERHARRLGHGQSDGPRDSRDRPDDDGHGHLPLGRNQRGDAADVRPVRGRRGRLAQGGHRGRSRRRGYALRVGREQPSERCGLLGADPASVRRGRHQHPAGLLPASQPRLPDGDQRAHAGRPRRVGQQLPQQRGGPHRHLHRQRNDCRVAPTRASRFVSASSDQTRAPGAST